MISCSGKARLKVERTRPCFAIFVLDFFLPRESANVCIYSTRAALLAPCDFFTQSIVDAALSLVPSSAP